MSKIALTPNANGSGIFTLASPNSNTNRTITLPDESVTLGAGTPSIDDNGNATAITIDSSENVQFGTTQTFPAFNNVVGCEVGGFGQISASRDGAEAMQLNRKSSDGDIAKFFKDGSTVGSIGTGGGGINFNSQGSDFAIRRSGTDVLYVGSTASYPGSDNSKDLGVSSFRWKDLYLSGGVYLGGTGAANKLEDYEEGTWTPADGSGQGLTLSTVSGMYTKVGRIVTVTAAFTYPSNSDNNYAIIQGLPFNASNTSDAEYAPGSIQTSYISSTMRHLAPLVYKNTNKFYFYNSELPLTNGNVSTKNFRVTLVYYTAS